MASVRSDDADADARSVDAGLACRRVGVDVPDPHQFGRRRRDANLRGDAVQRGASFRFFFSNSS